jgi:hypothetical protein
VPGRVGVWAQAAVNRTVHALVDLHPFRLGDSKAAPRLVQWLAGQWPAGEHPEADELSGGQALGVLAVTASEPRLDRRGPRPPGSASDGWSLAADAVALAAGAVASPVSDVVATAVDRVWPQRRWGGALVRLPGAWLPPFAVLPRADRGLDDPGTAWPTESVDFDARFAVHTRTVRTTAALLTPTVMTVLLDQLPADCAVAVSGDAVHTWWPYPPSPAAAGHAATVARATVQLARAFPSFVLREHPDLSQTVQAELDERAERARRYREGRRAGHSPDPVMQRMYDAARAEVGLPPA